jgi:hypothetical protein
MNDAVPAMTVAAGESALALIAERRGTDLLVSWNPESLAIPGAVVGMLFIRDTNATRNLLLTPEQLSYGHMLYAPTSDQVEIRLRVMDASQSTTVDSITVLLPQSSPGHRFIAQR